MTFKSEVLPGVEVVVIDALILGKPYVRVQTAGHTILIDAENENVYSFGEEQADE